MKYAIIKGILIIHIHEASIISFAIHYKITI